MYKVSIASNLRPSSCCQTLVGLDVSRCRTRKYNNNTYNYTELCNLLKLLVMLVCQYLYRVRCPCLYLCFIDLIPLSLLYLVLIL